MGAWGLGSFENDAALDWAVDLSRSPDAGPVESAIRVVARGGGYVDADDACAAVAAAEVVAALCGSPSSELPEDVGEWVARHPGVSGDLVRAAIDAVGRVEADSELRELWEEGEDLPAWLEMMAGLRRNLERCSAA